MVTLHSLQFWHWTRDPTCKLALVNIYINLITLTVLGLGTLLGDVVLSITVTAGTRTATAASSRAVLRKVASYNGVNCQNN